MTVDVADSGKVDLPLPALECVLAIRHRLSVELLEQPVGSIWIGFGARQGHRAASPLDIGCVPPETRRHARNQPVAESRLPDKRSELDRNLVDDSRPDGWWGLRVGTHGRFMVESPCIRAYRGEDDRVLITRATSHGGHLLVCRPVRVE